MYFLANGRITKLVDSCVGGKEDSHKAFVWSPTSRQLQAIILTERVQRGGSYPGLLAELHRPRSIRDTVYRQV